MSLDRSWYLAVAALVGLTACSQSPCPTHDLERRQIHVGDVGLTVEIASTPAERACGLSLRDRLAVNHGMLFVFPDDGIREFWMKDTRMPLSIAFLEANGRITEILDMDPREPARRYRSSQAVRYALETDRGWFSAQGISPGDRVDLGL